MKPLTIYVAGPISGLSYDDVVERYKKQVTALEGIGYDVLFPMAGKGYLRNEKRLKAHAYHNPVSTNNAIVGRDCWMVRQCDILLADLSMATAVSIGTVSEIAWAHILGRHIITILPEDNPHQHAFILSQSNIVFETTTEAYEYLRDFRRGVHGI